MSNASVRILRRSDHQLVEAELSDELRPADLLTIEQQWVGHRARIRSKLVRSCIEQSNWPESLHWDWSSKAPDLQFMSATGFSIELRGAIQGVMLTKTVPHVSMLDQGKPLVYIDYLETAPWNWNLRDIGQYGEYRGIGSILFLAAVQQSQREGFHGRVGLHALPQAEAFYAGTACQMTRLGTDPTKQDLAYFELPQHVAEMHLRDGGTR